MTGPIPTIAPISGAFLRLDFQFEGFRNHIFEFQEQCAGIWSIQFLLCLPGKHPVTSPLLQHLLQMGLHQPCVPSTGIITPGQYGPVTAEGGKCTLGRLNLGDVAQCLGRVSYIYICVCVWEWGTLSFSASCSSFSCLHWQFWRIARFQTHICIYIYIMIYIYICIIIFIIIIVIIIIKLYYILYYIIVYYIISYHIILYYIISYHIILNYIILYYIYMGCVWKIRLPAGYIPKWQRSFNHMEKWKNILKGLNVPNSIHAGSLIEGIYR